MEGLVWYAAYGSNLLRERFLTYILGGQPPGISERQVGCRDPSLPRADRALDVPHELYFARRSARWEHGGVAFVESVARAGAATRGRMYLITAEQFRQIVFQENEIHDFGADVGMDLNLTLREGTSLFHGHWYSRILSLGEEEGLPVFTFTAASDEERASPVRPGPAYLTTIIRGLLELGGMSAGEIAAYLRRAPGIQGSIPPSDLLGRVRALDPSAARDA